MFVCLPHNLLHPNFRQVFHSAPWSAWSIAVSNRETKIDGIRFEPVTTTLPAKPALAKRDPRQPLMGHLIFGVIYPAFVIIFELATRFCATSLFDPIPTIWHLLAVAFVPAMNFLVWAEARHPTPRISIKAANFLFFSLSS